jgi:hypothetical protein
MTDLPKPPPLNQDTMKKKIQELEARQQDMVQYTFAKYFGGDDMESYFAGYCSTEKVNGNEGEEYEIHESSIPPIQFYMTSNAIQRQADPPP